MLFKRSRSQPLGSRLTNLVWPRIGVRRSLRYLGYRIVRLDATSHSIAAGFAAGVAVSFTPFLGLHFVLAFTLSFLTRGHLLASAIGTFFGNPWTFPLIYSSTGAIGSYFMHVPQGAEVVSFSLHAFSDDPTGYFLNLLTVLKPFIIGSIPLAVVAWCVSYFLIKNLVDRYRNRKSQRLQMRADQRTKAETQSVAVPKPKSKDAPV